MMGSYNVILSENALKDLKKIDRIRLPEQQVLRIFNAIKSLENNPRPLGCKKLQETDDGTVVPNKSWSKLLDHLPNRRRIENRRCFVYPSSSHRVSSCALITQPSTATNVSIKAR
jgi:hypothetical protein